MTIWSVQGKTSPYVTFCLLVLLHRGTIDSHAYSALQLSLYPSIEEGTNDIIALTSLMDLC